MGLSRLGALLVGAIAAHASASDAPSSPLHLRLTAAIPIVHLGEMVVCSLSIEGQGVHEILAGTPDLVPENNMLKSAPGGFQQAFGINTKKVGQFEIGPYSAEFQGKRLTSNKLLITVIPKPPQDQVPPPNLTISRTRIKLGESTSILLEYSGDASFSGMTIDPVLGAEPRGSSTSMRFAKGPPVRFNSASYTLFPKKRGHFTLSSQTIKNLPAGIQLPEKSLDVE